MILLACKSSLTLHLVNTSEPQRLVRSGGEQARCKGTLRTVRVAQYENFMFNPEHPVLSCCAFFLDGDKEIVPELSSGNLSKFYLTTYHLSIV